MISFKIGILVLLLTLQIETLDNGLALLPPLVFSTFQLGCNYDENVLRGQVDQAAVSGLLSKGFKYMVLEDCWQGQRNTVSGKITPSLNKFPSGLPNFIAYANSKGMKVGLGTDIGSKTRSEKPGSFGYQKIDALTYAEWGIEWVSIWNSQNLSGVRARFTQMSEYLQESGRKVLISINNNHKDNVQVWGSSVANCWDSSSAQTASDWQALGKTFLSQVGHQAYSGSGSWNDAGFLSSRLPISEFLVQLVGWIGLKSPLKISVPLASFDNSKLSLILKDQLLEISQDSLKKQAKLLRHEQFERGWQQVWGGPLSGNRYVLIFVNGMSSVSQMSASLSKEAKISNFVSYWIRDPVTGTTLGSSSNDVVSANKVGSHSAEVRVLHS